MIGQNLTPGPTNSAKVQEFQAALRTKAKESPDFRFYSLYDKVYRLDVLHVAYERSRRNDGAPGGDGQTFDDIETYGRERWLSELAEELRKKTYEPQALRRAYVPKGNGQLRPLAPYLIKYSHDQGSCCANGSAPGHRADLRSRPAGRTARLPHGA